ncbi:SH3 and multiple ankyrin repeat domains protein 1 [Nephila pilipes]|uniref:SH3 and multiple ankyrin repeat domains protein 1 n=1 Tax=Nephila pilipes TaxID=299642 RepID=A0A8X6THM2_NEPPI|nr:SH3 and multiple ankyrin repeat domains protein 1 [Nephila pilipes]
MSGGYKSEPVSVAKDTVHPRRAGGGSSLRSQSLPPKISVNKSDKRSTTSSEAENSGVSEDFSDKQQTPIHTPTPLCPHTEAKRAIQESRECLRFSQKPLDKNATVVFINGKITEHKVEKKLEACDQKNAKEIALSLASELQSLRNSSAEKSSLEESLEVLRLQINSLGIGAVNEVDVFTELVPPSPKFYVAAAASSDITLEKNHIPLLK